MTAPHSATPGECVRAMDAKATPAPWVRIDPPYGGGSGCIRAHDHEAAVMYGRGWACARPNPQDLVTTATLRNALPALAALLDAADALRAPFVGNGRTETDWAFNIIAAVSAYDTARAAFLASVKPDA